MRCVTALAFVLSLSGCSAIVIGTTPDEVNSPADCYPHKWPVVWDGGVALASLGIGGIAGYFAATEDNLGTRSRNFLIGLAVFEGVAAIGYTASGIRGSEESAKCRRLLDGDQVAVEETAPEPSAPKHEIRDGTIRINPEGTKFPLLEFGAAYILVIAEGQGEPSPSLELSSYQESWSLECETNSTTADGRSYQSLRCEIPSVDFEALTRVDSLAIESDPFTGGVPCSQLGYTECGELFEELSDL